MTVTDEVGVSLGSVGTFTCSADLELGDNSVDLGVKGGSMVLSGQLIGAATTKLNLDVGDVIAGDGHSAIYNGTLRLAATNNDLFLGTIDVGQTRLNLNAVNGLRQATVNLVDSDNRFTYVDNALLGALSGTHDIQLSNRLRVGNRNSDASYSGDLNGTGSLTKVGTGAWELSGSGTFSGTTTVANGRIRFASANALRSSPLMINAQDGLDLDTHSIDANVHSLSGTGLINIRDNTLALTGHLDADVTYAGVLRDGRHGGFLTVNTTGSGKQILSGDSSSDNSIGFSLLSGTLQITGIEQMGGAVQDNGSHLVMGTWSCSPAKFHPGQACVVRGQ